MMNQHAACTLIYFDALNARDFDQAILDFLERRRLSVAPRHTNPGAVRQVMGD